MSPEDHPPRLKRLDWLYKQYPLYFLTANTKARQVFLANDPMHQAFRVFALRGIERGVFVGRYILMPDHIHLFVAFSEQYQNYILTRRQPLPGDPSAVTAACDRQHTGDGPAVADRRYSDEAENEDDGLHLPLLSLWMKSLKNSLSKTLRGRGVPAPHWQKGFFDHMLRSAESYAEKWLYVFENPVRKGLVSQPGDWPYQGEIYPLSAHGHV